MSNRDQPQAPNSNLEDTMLVAWLRLRGHQIVPLINREDSRVVFDIIGETQDIEESVRAYFDNDQVGVQDYVRALKQTKSEMYNMRKVAERRK